jgi:type IV secretion system protein VirD4
MVARLAYDLARTGLRIALQLWPLWLFWFALHAGSVLWRDLVLLPQADPTSRAYLLLYRAWPTAGLAGPVVLMLAAIGAHKAQLGSRTMAIAGILGTGLATLLTLEPEWLRLAPYIGQAAPLDILRAADDGTLLAFAFGVLATGAGVRLLHGQRPVRQARPGLVRAPSDTHGHADWLPIREARRLFPGPDPAFGGIVLGEAYRVDHDRTATGPFNPADRRSWGQGGTAPLLVDPCRDGPTHALVLAGSGGFKTTAVGIPTMLTWTASAVVLDPAREIGPMVEAFRERELGQRTVTLDPGDPASGSFNVLDWIDTASPLAESNVQAMATWLAGEPDRTRPESGREFFRSMGKALIACLLADLLWDTTLGSERSLRRLRQLLVTPEEGMREVLKRIHATSPSPLARDLAGTLMGLVAETFSGVYANANDATHWLSTKAFADLVSGSSFRTADLTKGRLTVFVQIPLKVLHSTPGLGRVVIGALLNAAYEADGNVEGRILFLLDEVARLGPMGVIEAARDAGRKYRLTLLLLYQSVGQLVQQWGREGARAWYDSTSWRLYAAVQDPETAKELSALCGEHGVLTSSHGESAGTQGRMGQLAAASSGRSETRSEVRRSLIKPDELLQDIRADEQFVIRRGSRPLRCGRAIYFRRPGMAAVVAPSRFHARPESAA